MSKNKTITNDEFLNMINGILPKNDRSNLMECYPEEEQEKYPDPTNPGTFYKNKMDMKGLIRFDKLCFMDAAEELGMFAKPVTNED